ncbi:unnamed protein product [Moneuplotes crassus]|uniref:Uncharacterized protein n=1 Tax=Euplotes crassus TaxID=5936 RepID=A0AAD1XHY1_EUPCR|nr:unnamed protein product [Moneuplotes crassus]
MSTAQGEASKLITKDSEEYNSFIKFVDFNCKNPSDRILCTDQWAFITQEQYDKLKGSKPKITCSKQYKDENAFLELAKKNKKYTEVGGIRYYHRFLDYDESEFSKEPKMKKLPDYMKQYSDKNAKKDDQEESKEASSNKASSKKCNLSKSDDSSTPKAAPFKRSAKVFDDEVYTIIGSLETAKINYIKGEVSSLKNQMFGTEKQLEAVHNVLFQSLSKLGLIGMMEESPLQNEINDLCYSNEAMDRLRQKTMQKLSVSKIIDELKGKETIEQSSQLNSDEDADMKDYELFQNDEKSGTDSIHKLIIAEEKKRARACQ